VFEELVPAVLAVIVGFLCLALIGALVSLAVLIPPIRKLGRRSTVARAAEVVIVGVVSFAVSFGLLTRLGAEVAYIFSTIGPPAWEEVEDALKPAIVEELWIRGLMPPPLMQPCYTTDAAVCQRADWATLGGEVSGGWGAYLMSVGVCLVSFVTGGFLARVFTRQRRPDAQ
jgi:hypothetical protein